MKFRNVIAWKFMNVLLNMLEFYFEWIDVCQPTCLEFYFEVLLNMLELLLMYVTVF
jgi:hypothetical protein